MGTKAHAIRRGAVAGVSTVGPAATRRRATTKPAQGSGRCGPEDDGECRPVKSSSSDRVFRCSGCSTDARARLLRPSAPRPPFPRVAGTDAWGGTPVSDHPKWWCTSTRSSCEHLRWRRGVKKSGLPALAEARAAPVQRQSCGRERCRGHGSETKPALRRVPSPRPGSFIMEINVTRRERGLPANAWPRRNRPRTKRRRGGEPRLPRATYRDVAHREVTAAGGPGVGSAREPRGRPGFMGPGAHGG